MRAKTTFRKCGIEPVFVIALNGDRNEIKIKFGLTLLLEVIAGSIWMSKITNAQISRELQRSKEPNQQKKVIHHKWLANVQNTVYINNKEQRIGQQYRYIQWCSRKGRSLVTRKSLFADFLFLFHPGIALKRLKSP